MAEISFKVTKAEMKLMEEHANEILRMLNLDPDTVRYEQNLKIVTENIGIILKEKGSTYHE